jgi:hypothetical protein
MPIPLENEIRDILQNKGISFINGYHSVFKELYDKTSNFRNLLQSKESSRNRLPFAQNSFWDISPKYRFDILRIDIVRIPNGFAAAIGLAYIYLLHLADTTPHYIPTFADFLFWNNIDYGIRLASSGWDRIALMIDSAFDLNLGNECNIVKVLSGIPKIDPNVVHQTNFKRLKQFRDQDFLELEAGLGRGARHETTHLVSPQTRYLFEFLDSHGVSPSPILPELSPEEKVKFLVKHYKLLINGIENASNLIYYQWPNRI